MMNLAKVSKPKGIVDIPPAKPMGMWKKRGMQFLIGATALAACMGPALPVFASDGGSPAISIEKPSGWKQGETTILVTVDDSNLDEGVTISKLEAKVGEGSWTDITSSHSITISGNSTVYVRATDSEGNTYEQNRSIKCYDTEKPTLSASLSDGVLTIKGNDTISGIKSITVNGAEYTDLTDGTLKVQLTQKDFTTKKIEITATDNAGNTSDTYSLQNPYYEWAVKQAIAKSADSGSGTSSASGSTTGTTSTGTTSTGSSSGGTTSTGTTSTGSSSDSGTTSPLPQSATASEPTSATGTVTDRTVTGIEESLATQNETVDTISSTTTEAGKEFYTITTKSGKVFYLIIDNEQSQDNVYFLTEVDEEDLMNFTLSDTVTLPDVDTVYATVDDGSDEQVESEATEEESESESESESEEETEAEPEERKSGAGAYLLIGLIAAGIGAGAWYMKIYKPKHEFDDEDEYEDEDDEENEPYENEDEQPQGESEPEVLEDEDDEEDLNEEDLNEDDSSEGDE